MSEDLPELSTTESEEVLHLYKINQSKLVKVEHHIHFLEDSIKEFKIPKGLQINKEYPAIDEIEDFRAHIREIQLNAEMEIVNAILNHYKQLFKTLCSKNIKRLEELTTTTSNIGKKTQEIDKPIKQMKNKPQEKRTNKLNNIKTHIQIGKTYVSKKKEPKQTRADQPSDHQRKMPAPHQCDINYKLPQEDPTETPTTNHQEDSSMTTTNTMTCRNTSKQVSFIYEQVKQLIEFYCIVYLHNWKQMQIYSNVV